MRPRRRPALPSGARPVPACAASGASWPGRLMASLHPSLNHFVAGRARQRPASAVTLVPREAQNVRPRCSRVTGGPAAHRQRGDPAALQEGHDEQPARHQARDALRRLHRPHARLRRAAPRVRCGPRRRSATWPNLAAWPRCARVCSAPGRPHGAQAGRGSVRRTHERVRLHIRQTRAPADSGCEEGSGAGWAVSAP